MRRNLVQTSESRIDHSRMERAAPISSQFPKNKYGEVIDEHYLNFKISNLNHQRQDVHELAAKYGLNTYSQIDFLSQITIDRHKTKGPDGKEQSNLTAVKDFKDRVSLYHQ